MTLCDCGSKLVKASSYLVKDKKILHFITWSTLKEATANEYYPNITKYKKAVKKQTHKKI